MTEYVTITLPDGRAVRFPSSMTRAQMADALNSFPAPKGGASTNSEAVAELGSKARSLAMGGQNGASYGLADNAVGVMSAITGAVPNEGGGKRLFDYSGSFGDRYEQSRDLQRGQFNDAREANPGAFMAGDVGGAVVQALTTLPIATGATIWNTIARGTGIGAVEGTLQGAGNADGVDVGKKALAGGLLGSILGGGAPVAALAGSKATRLLSDPAGGLIDLALGRANQGKANRTITSALQKSGQGSDDVARSIAKAAADGQPEYTLMDALGMPGQRTANGIVRGGDSKAGLDLADFLEKRQLGQPERVSRFIDDAFGMNGQSAEQTRTAMTSARGKAADTAYSAARGNAAPVDVRGAISVIDNRIGGMNGSGVVGDGIDGKLASYRNRLAAKPPPNGEISRELSDFDRVLGVKQSIQDDIGAAVRAGRNNEARELGKLVEELDAALENSSDMYRTANDGFRKASTEIDAIDQGVDMLRPVRRETDTTQQFGKMTPEQQQAARTGYGDRMLSGIEANKAPTANRAKAVQSTKMDAEAAAMAIDPDTYARRLARETEMWMTQNKALQGSATANNLQDIEGASRTSGGLFQALQKAGNFQLGDAAAQIMATLGPMSKGQTEATKQLIAKALMSTDPMAVLAPALRQEAGSQQTRRVIESIIRNTGGALGR